MPHGLLITLEGGEACGKSTQLVLLGDRLREAGGNVCLLREPGGTPLGEKIRHLLKHDPAGQGMAAETELLLLNASRAQLVRQVIVPALAAGQRVLCDRFFDSTLAYQGFGRGLDLTLVRSVVAAAVGPVRPDLTIWLRIPPAEATRRLAARNDGWDRFEAEQTEFFQRVESGYEHLAAAEPERFREVDGMGEPAAVVERIWEVVEPVLLSGVRREA